MAESNGNSTVEIAEPKVVDKEEKNGNETEVSNLDRQIIHQIEYYFGDINLPKDKFLQEQVKLEDGWIPLEIMLKFQRLSNLSTNPEVILISLAKSSSNLMEISEDRKKIRRSPDIPLPIYNEERRKDIMNRTVYVKGFPATGFTLDDALSYFSTFGKVENIQLRNYKDKATNQYIFKGSVYVVFKNIDEAKAFMEQELIKHEKCESELTKKWQFDHLEEKRVLRVEKKMTSKEERKKPETDETKDNGLTKGAVLHLTGFSGDITREDIKKDLQALGANIAFVDFKKGDSEGWVRLDKENAAKEVLEKMENGKFKISDVELDVKVLEGEVEEAYLAKTLEDMKKRRANHSNRGGRGRGFRGGGRGRGGFRGGRGGDRGHKRKGSPSRDGGNAAKKQAV